MNKRCNTPYSVAPSEQYQTLPGSHNKLEVANRMRDIERKQPNTDFQINGKSWKLRMHQREQWRKRQAAIQKKSDIIKKAARYIYRVKAASVTSDKINELLKGYKWGITLTDGTYKLAPTDDEQDAIDWSNWRQFKNAPEDSMKNKKTGTCVDVAKYILQNIPGSSCVLRVDSEDPEAFHVTPIIKDDDGKYTYVRQFYGNDNFVSKNKSDTIAELVDMMPLPEKAFNGEVFHYYPLAKIPEHENLGDLLDKVKVVSKPLKKECVK